MPHPLDDPELDRPGGPKAGPVRGDSGECLMLGILAMFLWVFPPLGLPIAALGLFEGWQAGPDRDHPRARLGFVLATIALVMNILVCAWFIGLLMVLAEFD